jgi:hypothetical protein
MLFHSSTLLPSNKDTSLPINFNKLFRKSHLVRTGFIVVFKNIVSRATVLIQEDFYPVPDHTPQTCKKGHCFPAVVFPGFICEFLSSLIYNITYLKQESLRLV